MYWTFFLFQEHWSLQFPELLLQSGSSWAQHLPRIIMFSYSIGTYEPILHPLIWTYQILNFGSTIVLGNLYASLNVASRVSFEFLQTTINFKPGLWNKYNKGFRNPQHFLCHPCWIQHLMPLEVLHGMKSWPYWSEIRTSSSWKNELKPSANIDQSKLVFVT